MKENNDKRVSRVELEDEVKKVSITGVNGGEKVVMRQNLDEDDLELVTGGEGGYIRDGTYDETGGEGTFVLQIRWLSNK